MQQNCDRLSHVFGRPITGVHNQTYGLVGDISECIIQRSFDYNTFGVRFAYDYIKGCLTDKSLRKVVLVCHSQGAIISSMVLDLLYVDLPAQVVSKLEVYTFGSAASHFNNPLLASNTRTPGAPNRVIQHMEHYVNGDDLVPRWGVLQGVQKRLENRYCGKVFVRNKATGHMLNQHYLGYMFPLPQQEDKVGFLDREVSFDTDAALNRERIANRLWMTLQGKTPEGVIRDVSGAKIPSHSAHEAYEESLNMEVEGEMLEGEAENAINEISFEPFGQGAYKVRDLSRLWMYMGGKDPDDEPSSPPDSGPASSS